MKRYWIFWVGPLSIIFLVGGIWFVYGKKDSQTFENVPMITPHPRALPSEDVSSPDTSLHIAEAENPPMVPPQGVSPNSSSQSSSEVSSLSLTSHLVSFGYSPGPSARQIDTVVIHSSYNAGSGDPFNDQKIFDEWKAESVSPHYFLNRTGTIYRLVKENDIAYHAGVSKMPDGRTNVNDFSIGIEMDGTLTSGYTDKQYASLNALIADIKTRHPVKFVVGHSDIAPGRKTDPWKFDWKKVKE